MDQIGFVKYEIFNVDLVGHLVMEWGSFVETQLSDFFFLFGEMEIYEKL